MARFDLARKLVTQSVDLFHQSTYPDRMYVYAWHLFHDFKLNHSQSVSANITSVKQATSAFFKWFETDFRASPDQFRYAFELLDAHLTVFGKCGFPSTERRKLFIDAEILPAWISEMVQAEYWSELAWEARGGGYANTVAQSGWERYGSFNLKSVDFAEQAFRINPAFPHAAARLQNLAYQGAGDESPEYWMNKAKEVQIDFDSPYYTFFNFASPKWGGDAKRLLQFGLDCYKTDRFDTRVPEYLINVLGQLVEEFDWDEIQDLVQQPEVYRAMHDCLSRYM